MPPSREEAAQALREISNVQARVAGFQDYRFEASQLILWGLLNIIGCVGSALFAGYLLPIWLGVVVVGLLLGVFMAVHSAPRVPGVIWRYLLVILSILLFDVILHVIFWPVSPRQGSMIVPLFVATIYIVRGAQSRPRTSPLAPCWRCSACSASCLQVMATGTGLHSAGAAPLWSRASG